jgi:hypothetical protein
MTSQSLATVHALGNRPALQSVIGRAVAAITGLRESNSCQNASSYLPPRNLANDFRIELERRFVGQ